MCAESKNMKLLSICIPTYNRPDELKALYQSFLCRALDEYGDQIEVVVCDNSDEKNAYLNQAILGSAVLYYKNETNVGFGGNLIRCVREATGEFIWIISDDDLILWDGFKRLMDCLKTASDDGIDLILLPYHFRNVVGELIVAECAVKEDIDVATYIRNLSAVPFVYFASVVVRLDKKHVDWVQEKFYDNNLLNIPLFLSMLKPESRLRFLDIPVIEFLEKYYAPMNILGFYIGACDVVLYLEKEYGVNGHLLIKDIYKGSLLAMLTHNIGLHAYLKGDETRWHLLAKLRQNLDIKNLILAIMVALPGGLARPIYLFLESLRLGVSGNPSIRSVLSRFKNLSIKKVILRYRTSQHYIRTKQDERWSYK